MNFLATALVKGGTAFLTKLIMSVASEKMIAYTFFKLVEAIAKCTSTKHDDEWAKRLKEQYEDIK